MAVRNLVASMQCLSIQGIAASSVNCIGGQNIRLLQTCSVMYRKLDSRAYPPYKLPSSKNNRWVVRKPFKELYDYTVEPLPFPRWGGRGPNGRIWNHRRGGGLKKVYHMVKHFRGGPTTGAPLQEKIDSIIVTKHRTAHLALVASGENKRYIIATQHMKPGDIINSSQVLSETAIRAKEGDSHPVGSLPVGSIISNVELYSGNGAQVAVAAGTQAQIVRKLGDKCIIKMPSKREIQVSSKCIATVGRVSNVDHNKKKLGKAGALRWMGIKQRSGRWHRKTGRFGRKIKPIPRMKVYETKAVKRQVPVRITRAT